ncbi:hypothetical protein TURU_115590 [Turdus rufiventris]|nr:hypothetical protein TURU_115590 [Turdus rufiventris]
MEILLLISIEYESYTVGSFHKTRLEEIPGKAAPLSKEPGYGHGFSSPHPLASPVLCDTSAPITHLLEVLPLHPQTKQKQHHLCSLMKPLISVRRAAESWAQASGCSRKAALNLAMLLLLLL